MENLEQIYTNQLSQVLRQFQPKMSDVNELFSIICMLDVENPNKYREINLRLAKKRLEEIT